MSGLISGLVWELPISKQFTREKKYILLAYADHADQNGRNIYPSVDLIATKTGYSERSVQYATSDLLELGFLIEDGIGPRGTNKFRIPLERGQDGGAKIAPPGKTPERGAKSAPPAPESVAPEGIAPEPSVEVKDSTTTTGEAAPKNNADLYQENFGALTPVISEKLSSLEKAYSAEWLAAALREALVNEARNLKYVEAILSRWKTDGFQTRRRKFRKDKTPASSTTPRGFSAIDQALGCA